jgi:hypothetical protein
MLRTMQRLVSAAALVCAIAGPASAQTYGVHGGIGTDPKQGFAGVQAEWQALAPHTNLSFRPDAEVLFGSGQTNVIADFLFALRAPLNQRWQLYAGVGPALVYAHVTDSNCGAGTGCSSNSASGTFTALVGFQNQGRLFFEMRVGAAAGSPSLRVDVGLNLKGRK